MLVACRATLQTYIDIRSVPIQWLQKRIERVIFSTPLSILTPNIEIQLQPGLGINSTLESDSG